MDVTHAFFTEKDQYVDDKVFITVPFKKREKNGKTWRVVIETKPHTWTGKEDVRVVINFRVYWEADGEDPEPITNFRPHGMDLKVGFGSKEPGPDLLWHSDPRGDQWTKLDHASIESEVDDKTLGYGVTTVLDWLDDPNVGWGGG